MAARFRFRLETLVKLRKSLEELAQRHLAQVLTHRDVLVLRLQVVEKQREDAVESRRIGKGEPVDLDRWRQVERYLVVLERSIHQVREALAQAEARVAQARAQVLKTHQDHMMLLRLRERRKEQFDLETLHQEIRDMDEIAVLRHRLKANPSLSDSAAEAGKAAV